MTEILLFRLLFSLETQLNKLRIDFFILEIKSAFTIFILLLLIVNG